MANMLEGGGKTPLVAPEELEQMGFKLVAYPLSLLGVSMRAMQSALQLLKVGYLCLPLCHVLPSPSGYIASYVILLPRVITPYCRLQSNNTPPAMERMRI